MSKPVDIPWPLSTAPGKSPQESGGRLLNVSAEPLGQESAIKVVWRRQPGLSKFCDLALTPYRGGILVNNLAYIAVGTKVVTVTSGGVVTVAGTLPGNDKVTFARDNEATPAIQCVSPANGAFAVTSVSVTAFNGGGALPAPNWTAGQDSYIFWGIGDNRVFAAGPNTTVLNANTFTTIQSRPTGNLLRGVPYQGLMFFFATEFCEIWSDQANPFPAFPYSRYAVIDCGLFGRNAIAGWEDGFGNLQWVGPGPNGLGVYQLNGASPQKVSPNDLDRLIQAIAPANADTLEAYVYSNEGKNFWVLSSPTWTWEFNINTQKWNERKSLSAGLFSRWRATGPSLNAFGSWLCGDMLSTQLLFIDPTNQQEVGTPLLFRMESAPVLQFPNRLQVARADFNFVAGVGMSSSITQTGQDPQVSISASRDGGANWDNPRLRRLGRQAQARQNVYVTNLGMAQSFGMRFRISISDEVYASFIGATMSDDPRAN